MLLRSAAALALVAAWLVFAGGPALQGQPAVKVTAAWATASASDTASAFATVDNGTMYDIYLVGAASEAAGSVELVRMTDGKPVGVKEVAVAAFDRLEMSPDGTFVRLTNLKRAFKSGDHITITLETDSTPLTVDAVVK
jgi:copper(I)-binding protein